MKKICFISIVALSFTLALGLIDDVDIWWHLKCGEKFIREGWIPHYETFSYTSASRQWVNGYLLADAMFYVAWLAGGPGGVALFGAALVACAYAIALMMSRGGPGYYAALVASIPAVFMAYGVMIPAPALFTHIFALLSIWLLESHRLKGGRRIWLLLPLTAFWANCHPGFFYAFALTGVYIAGNLSRALLSKLSKRKLENQDKLRILLLVFGGQILATLLNPYGYKVYYSPIVLLTHSQISRGVLNLTPLFSGSETLAGTIPCFLAVAAFGAACFLWSARRARPEHIILFALFALATVSMRRNLLLFGSIALPLISWTISESAASTERLRAASRAFKAGSRVKTAVGAFVILLSTFLLWFAATDRLYFYTRTLHSIGLGINRDVFSEGAIELLQKESIAGNIFHHYDSGGYLIFNLYPRYRVFNDSRLYPFPDEVLNLGQEAMTSPDSFEYVKFRYNIRAVLLPIHRPDTWKLVIALLNNPLWAVVYADGAAILFLERGAGNDSIIVKYEMNLMKDFPSLPSPPPAQTKFRLWDRAKTPYGRIFWAMIYSRIGKPDMASQILEPALNYRPVMKGLKEWITSLKNQSA